MARVTTLAGFRKRFPEFTVAVVDDGDANEALDLAHRVNSRIPYLAYYVAAHAIVSNHLRNPNSVDGGVYPIAGEGVGGQSTGYQLPPSGDALNAWLTLTEYGRRYLALRHSSPASSIAARVVG